MSSTSNISLLFSFLSLLINPRIFPVTPDPGSLISPNDKSSTCRDYRLHFFFFKFSFIL